MHVMGACKSAKGAPLYKAADPDARGPHVPSCTSSNRAKHAGTMDEISRGMGSWGLVGAMTRWRR